MVTGVSCGAVGFAEVLGAWVATAPPLELSSGEVSMAETCQRPEAAVTVSGKVTWVAV
ncbi:hypothetical protein TSHO111613_24825 [Tsukamurella hominis]